MAENRPTDPLGEIYAEWTVEFTSAPDMSLPVLRWVFEDWQRATANRRGRDVPFDEHRGVPGILVTPLEADRDRILLVLHGGGFALGSSASHRKMAGHLARAAGSSAFVADFRLAPEHPYPAQLDDADAVIDALLGDGYAPEAITPVGDSAGASIAIATVLRRLQRGAALPGRVVTISPWVDMENSGETIETNDATDFLIAREGLQGNIDRYLSGGASPTDPLVNPLYADFTGFPPLFITASDAESLYADAVRLAERAARDGGRRHVRDRHGRTARLAPPGGAARPRRHLHPSNRRMGAHDQLVARLGMTPSTERPPP